MSAARGSAFIDPFGGSGFLFNRPEHLHLQTPGPVYWQTLLHSETGFVQARCAFIIKDDMAVSPAAAPFGSIEFTPGLPLPALSQFVNALVDQARKTGSKRLKLVNYPHCYAPQQVEQLTQLLLAQDFTVVRSSLTYYLPVAAHSLTYQMRASEQRRLRKSERAGLEASHWPKPDSQVVINFIQASRAAAGYPLTIAPPQLAQLLTHFPDEFPVFVVHDGPVIAALCVGVRVRGDILYTFLPASRNNYQSLSPMVMLLDRLYQFCQQQDIRLLDLGTCLDHHQQAKPGLIRFKENLGAHPSPKLTFERAL